MQNTISEIVSSYKRADNKREQIKILAELNACDKETIQQILINEGVNPAEFSVKRRRKRNQEASETSDSYSVDTSEVTAVTTENAETQTETQSNEIQSKEPDIEPELPLPFNDDDMGDDFVSGAITGGFGDVPGYGEEVDLGSIGQYGYEPPLRTYRTAEELLTEPEDMTPEEMVRLERIKAIPKIIREILNNELRTLHNQIMELEKKTDCISDFLNGEKV